MSSFFSIGLVPACLLFWCASGYADEQPATTADNLREAAQSAAQEGDLAGAIRSISEAIQAKPDDARLYVTRADLFDRTRKHREAIADYDFALKQDRENASLLFRRGCARFKSGDAAGSIADWDLQIQLTPQAEKSHWQRGISYYYAGEFRKGQRQFELYQTFDDNDVENVVWRFLCQARVDGVEKAREAMLDVRRDRRVPMMEIDALYRGLATVDDVFAAVKKGDPTEQVLNYRLFYAHLYAGLYYEALENAAKARHHILEADKRVIGHYMWDVAHVHAGRLRRAGKR